MNVTEVLKKARWVISSPENWTKGCLARTADDRETSTTEQEACKFCAYGAIWCVKDGFEFGDALADIYPALDLLDDLSPIQTGLSRSAAFNDHPNTTHAEVLALFDRAIAESEKGRIICNEHG